MKLSPTELMVGFCIQIPFFYILGLWVLPLCLFSGLLWAIGGGGLKIARRLGVPTLTGLALFVGAHSWIALLGIPGAVLACSLGYGEKSWLWCFFYAIHDNHSVADYLTRLLTYILFWLSFGAALIFI